MTWYEENEEDFTWQSFPAETFDSVPSDLRFDSDAWVGLKENMEVDGTNLIFSTGETEGKYTSLVRDVGYVAPFRIFVAPVFTAVSADTFDSVGGAKFDDSTTKRWSGEEVSIESLIEIRTSEDNITWGDWEEWQDVDYYCRYFQLRFTFTRASTATAVQCSSIKTIADLPDVDEFGVGEVTVAADGVEILYEKTFHENPAVNIEILSGDGKVATFTVAPTTTGFTVKLLDLSGVAKTGTFGYHIHGV